jgi:hypothetical protein
MQILSTIQPVYIVEHRERVPRKGLTMMESDVPIFLDDKTKEITK